MIIMFIVAGMVLRWPFVAQNGDVDAGHLRPLRGGVVWDRHVDHLLPGLFDSRISVMVRLSRLPSVFFGSALASLGLAAALAAGSAMDITLPSRLLRAH